MTLDHLVKVQILVPQLLKALRDNELRKAFCLFPGRLVHHVVVQNRGPCLEQIHHNANRHDNLSGQIRPECPLTRSGLGPKNF